MLKAAFYFLIALFALTFSVCFAQVNSDVVNLNDIDINIIEIENIEFDNTEFDDIEFDDMSLDDEAFDTTSIYDINDDITERSWRLDFAWQNGTDLNELSQTISHRLDARLNVEKLVFNDYFFKMDAKILTRLRGDDSLSNQSSVEIDTRLRELFIQRSQSDWTLTSGFQILTLGEMDAVQISDVLSPWDYSEFAFTAPEDARLGQFMINAQGYRNNSRWQFIYSPWPLSNRYPGGNADTLMQRLLGSTEVMVNDNQPKPLQAHELLTQWQTTIESSDLTLLYGNLLSNDPVFHRTSDENDDIIRFETEYYRFHLFSLSGNYSLGNVLWKFETAYKKGIQYQSDTVLEKDLWELAVGFDYDANGAWALAFEVLNQHILGDTGDMATIQQNSTQIVTRWNKQWRHETLSTVVFFNYQLQYQDMVTSLALDYAVNDNTKASLVGSIFYSTDEHSPAQLSKDWDQIVFRVNYAY